jgi:hypothetical protein
LTRLRSLAIVILSAIVPVVAVLITWLTGILTSQYEPGGFPFQWKTLGPRCLVCPIPSIIYDWTAFALDVLFYSAIGYGLLLGYARYHASKPAGLMPKQN